jgi:hypothetical protein
MRRFPFGESLFHEIVMAAGLGLTDLLQFGLILC